MDRKSFIELVEEFSQMYVTEYADSEPVIQIIDASWPDAVDIEITANITFTTMGPHEWVVPIGVNEWGEVAIAAAPDVNMYLELDGGGLYAYLWHEAVSRISHV